MGDLVRIRCDLERAAVCDGSTHIDSTKAQLCGCSDESIISNTFLKVSLA